MRTLLVALAVGLLSIAGCSPGIEGAPVSEAAAIRSAQSSVDDLDYTSQPYAGNFVVTRTYKTSSAGRVIDYAGDVLTIDPAPSNAWVVELSAPPQNIWQVITADAQSGVVRAAGLWKIPAGRPSKSP